MKIFTLPDLGEGLQEAEVVAWHVAEGDHVVADQPLVSVETDKAVVEVPSPQAGHVARLCAKLHERVKVGAPLVEFEGATHPDEGAIVGDLPEKPKAPAPRTPTQGAAPLAAPAVRALARTLGVELASVTGTGPGGAIVAADIEAAAKAGRAPALHGEPLSATRRAMADNMARAHREVAPATVIDDADIDAWPADADVTMRLVRAVAKAAAAVPAINAWYDSRSQTVERRAEADIAIAVDTDAGLIVPVLTGAQRRTAPELAAELRRLTEAARGRTLKPAELRGGSITLSNFGALGGRYAALVVVPPQVAIVGAGRAVPRAVASAGRAAIHRVLPLSLTFDHRAITGAEAARFLTALIADLQRSD